MLISMTTPTTLWQLHGSQSSSCASSSASPYQVRALWSGVPGQSPLVGRTRSGPVWPSGRTYQVRALWSGVPGQGPYGPLVGYQVRACMALWSGVPGQSPLVGAYQVRARMALFHATLHALIEYMYSVYTAWAVCLIHVHVQCKSPLHAYMLHLQCVNLPYTFLKHSQCAVHTLYILV